MEGERYRSSERERHNVSVCVCRGGGRRGEASYVLASDFTKVKKKKNSICCRSALMPPISTSAALRLCKLPKHNISLHEHQPDEGSKTRISHWWRAASTRSADIAPLWGLACLSERQCPRSDLPGPSPYLAQKPLSAVDISEQRCLS